MLLDRLSEFLAKRKGLLPLLGMVMIFLNLILQFIPWGGPFASTNLLLHLGVIVAVSGLLLARAL